MKLTHFGLAAAVAVAGLLAQPALAQQAQPAPSGSAAVPSSMSAEVIILHGTNDGTGIDPRIGKMPALGQPPFSSYNSYKLLDRVKLPLTQGKSTTTKLPTGRDLLIALKDVLLGKKKDEPKKYVVSASVQSPDGNTFLPLLEVNAKAGETFFVAGQKYKGGTLVIGITVSP